MMSRKLIALFLALTLVFSLASCKDDRDDDLVNVEDDDNPPTVTYVYGDAHTVHRENCIYATKISELYKKTYSGDLTVLVEEDFSFCGLCCPEEKALYESIDFDSGVDPEYATYVINISQYKIHTLDCRFVEEMAPHNKVYTDLPISALEEDGYYACQTCNPD